MQRKLQFPRAYVLLLNSESLLSKKLVEGVIEREGLTSCLWTRWWWGLIKIPHFLITTSSSDHLSPPHASTPGIAASNSEQPCIFWSFEQPQVWWRSRQRMTAEQNNSNGNIIIIPLPPWYPRAHSNWIKNTSTMETNTQACINNSKFGGNWNWASLLDKIKLTDTLVIYEIFWLWLQSLTSHRMIYQ